MKINVSEFIASLKEMTVLELNELVKAIEEEFGMKFSMKEVVGMNNVGELAEIVAARRKR